MSYEDYKAIRRASGMSPGSKVDIYNEAYEKALNDAARAVGITITALKSMIGSNTK